MGNDFYVYVHETKNGDVFYVGKGSGDRAWRKGRDLNWNTYVEEHLNNEYNVRIVLENLSEQRALEEEEVLMAKYGDQLVNRINMSRTLNIPALNVRNEIDAKRKKVELDAELASDPNQKADLFIEALKFQKLSANTIFENGLVGKLLAARPIGDIQLLDKTVRSLIAANRKEEAQAIFDQYFLDFPQDKSLTKVPSIAKVIERGTVKLPDQQDFVAPDPLPEGWQYSKERHEQVLRLDHKFYETDKSLKYDIAVLENLIETDLQAAMLYVKQWIVRDEKVGRKNPMDNELWLYGMAKKIANKQKNLMEEYLFQNRYTNLLQGRSKHYDKNLIILRKLSAKYAKKNAV